VATGENGVLGLWQRIGAAGRVGVALGVAAALGLVGWYASSSSEVEYRVLFSDLAETDAAAIV
jgi:flagellar biosynthesis/type III secretory pathway M-ring protein FliF/YscJ